MESVQSKTHCLLTGFNLYPNTRHPRDGGGGGGGGGEEGETVCSGLAFATNCLNL